jgi:hypothetical protein
LPLSSAEPPAWAPALVDHVRTASFPELSRVRIQVGELRSHTDFFRARPALLDLFLPKRMRYVLLVNPDAGVPSKVAVRKRRVYLTPDEIERRLRRSSATISRTVAGL